MAQSWETEFVYPHLTSLNMHHALLCVSGARSLAGNCSSDPTPCCSVAHYLFNPATASRVSHAHLSTLRRQPETQTAGMLADTPTC